MRFEPRSRKTLRIAGVCAVAGTVAVALLVSVALAAQAPVGLGVADGFAVLAGSAVTNTGPSTINGDLGVSPGTAVSGIPPATLNGSLHAADAVAGQAQSDLTIAYNDAAGRTPPLSVSGDLGGLTLTSGVYKSGSSLGLTGTLTLDAQGNPNAVFVFQAGSALTTASGSHVALVNGADACNVYWQIGSSATLGTSSVFTGNLMALTSISMNANVDVHGRALARNGAVTLIDDTITPAHCATAGTGTTGGTPGTTGAPGTGPTGSTGAPGSKGVAGSSNGTAVFTTAPRPVAVDVGRFGTTRCVHGTFRVVVHGLRIRRVGFWLGTQLLSTRSHTPFAAMVAASSGIHTVTAHVFFSDRTRTATLRFRFRACAAAKAPAPSQPQRGGGFTG
jgi:hypothetical protein